MAESMHGVNDVIVSHGYLQKEAAYGICGPFPLLLCIILSRVLLAPSLLKYIPQRKQYHSIC